MLRQIIPVQTVPAQTFNIVLNDQHCRINIYTRTTGLYVDIGRDNVLIIGGVLAHDRNWIVREAYFGFLGDIAFWDTQGINDPEWQGLNTRYYLGYWA
jgi:hypothetical protein